MRHLGSAFGLIALLALTFQPLSAAALPVATQLNVGNAASLLFVGPDAHGGIDDWYVSNGVIQAVIDDVGPQADLVPLLGGNAPPKVSEFAFTGCSVLDLGNNGQNNDHLAQMFTVGGLSTKNFIVYSAVSASSTATSATITCTGNLLGFDSGATPVPPSDLAVVTEYTASGSDPFLTVTTTVTNNNATNAAASLGGFLDVALWTQRAQVPFSPLAGKGFKHAVLDFSNIVTALETPPFAAAPGVVRGIDGVVDPPSGTIAHDNTYGMLGVQASIDQDGAGPNPPTVAAVNVLFGVSSNFLSALGNPPLGSLQPGGVLTYTRRIYVAPRADVASVSNPMITELAARQSFATGTISGHVSAADAPSLESSVIATRTGGPALPAFAPSTPVTQFRTYGDGNFSGVVLPVGTYSLEVRAAEREPVTVAGVVVNASADTAVSVPALTALATLNVNIALPGPHNPIPGKITIKGIAPTLDPRLRSDVIAIGDPLVGPDFDLRLESFSGGPALANILYVDAQGLGSVSLRPGKYQIIASHGPEYSVRKRNITLRAGRPRKVTMRLAHVVDTTGFISGDFHIHSMKSLDSSAPLEDRVRAFAGEGVEVMVSTDHDYIVDYSSLITNMQFTPFVTSIVGDEITGSVPNPPVFPDSIGHIISWPLVVQPQARRDGAIEDEFVAPNWVFKRLHDQSVDVIQYNHPRAGVSGITSIGFFNNFGYDPSLPITSPPNNLLIDDDITGPGTSGVANPSGLRNIDFDVMEIINGTEVPAYIAVRRDWLSLLNQIGPNVPFIAGTSNSDSHRVALESAGYGRNYVGGAGDSPTALNVTAFDGNVKAGNMFGTTGPFVRFQVLDALGASAGLGGTLVPSNGNVRLKIQVQAPAWIPVEQVRVIANGFNVMTFDASTTPKVKPGPKNEFSQGKAGVVRFDAEIPVTVAVDTYFIVEAGAKLSPLPSPTPLIDEVVPGMVPMAFTNPIFVDLAGNGFDSPGLPVMASASTSQLADELPRFARVERTDETWIARARSLLHATLAAIPRPRFAWAQGDNKTVLTGRELAAQVQRDKSSSTPDYFPLYKFEIPQSAVAGAVKQMPQAEQDAIKAARAKAGAAD